MTRGAKLFAAMASVLGIVLSSQLAYANPELDVENISDLPVVTCEDLFVPAGGSLVFEDSDVGHAQCVYDTAGGQVVFGWFFDGFIYSEQPDFAWIMYGPDAVVDFGEAQESQESFGDYFFWTDSRRDEVQPGFSFTDTASARWGLHFQDSITFSGPPQAISAMLEVLQDRIARLYQERDLMESREFNEGMFDPDAPRCADVWDGTGLAQEYELVTTGAFTFFLQCEVHLAGVNPYARDSFPVVRFSYFRLDPCVPEEFLQEQEFARSNYRFSEERDFGTYFFDSYGFAGIVAGEETDLEGVVFNDQNCGIYSGWPEAITRLINFFDGDSLQSSTSTDPGDQEAVAQAVSGEPLALSLPNPLTLASGVAALGSLALVGVTLVLRRLRSGSRPTEAPPTLSLHRQEPDMPAPNANRQALYVVSAALLVLASVFGPLLDPALRQGVLGGQFDVTRWAQLGGQWLVVALIAVVLGVVIAGSSSAIVGYTANIPLLVSSATGVVAGAVALGWPLGVGAVVPLVAVVMAVAAWETVSASRIRPLTLGLGGLILGALGLWTLADVGATTALWSEGVTQALLIGWGVLATSVALLSLPIRHLPGRVTMEKHPWMWAFVMGVGWWMLNLVADWGIISILLSSGVALLLVVVTVFFPARKRDIRDHNEVSSA